VITAAAVLVTVLLAALTVFQIALAAGAPLGHLAWGGQHRGVLPVAYRVGSAITVVVYALLAWLVWRAVDQPDDPWIWVVTGYFGLGVLMNAASRSRAERLVMTPVALLLALGCLVIALG
jgi:hypothetical protein